jgi:hypothetical protein
MEIRCLVMASSDLEKSRNGTLLGFGGAGRVVGSLAGFDACWSPGGPSRAAPVTLLTLSFVSSVKDRINSAYVALRVLNGKPLILLSFL